MFEATASRRRSLNCFAKTFLELLRRAVIVPTEHVIEVTKIRDADCFCNFGDANVPSQQKLLGFFDSFIGDEFGETHSECFLEGFDEMRIAHIHKGTCIVYGELARQLLFNEVDSRLQSLEHAIVVIVKQLSAVITEEQQQDALDS